MGGPCPPLPAVSARAVSSVRLVWCVSSCRSAFAFVLLRCISSAVCALRTRWSQRALRPLLWDRPHRALRLRQLLLLHRAPGQSARLPLLSTWLRHGRHLLHVPALCLGIGRLAQPRGCFSASPIFIERALSASDLLCLPLSYATLLFAMHGRVALRVSSQSCSSTAASRPASKQTHYFAPDRLVRRSALLIGLAMTHYLSGLWGWGRRLRPSAVLIGLYYPSMPNRVCVLFRALWRFAGRTLLLIDLLIDGFFCPPPGSSSGRGFSFGGVGVFFAFVSSEAHTS